MHLYFFLRGKFEQVELWKCHAQTSYWKWRRFNEKTQKEEIKLVQGALRPSVLGTYEYIFPREALAEVCSFFGILPPINKNDEYHSFSPKALDFLRMATLRKMFRCKKIPKKILNKAATIPDTFTTEEFERGVTNCKIPGVSMHVIGIKDDEYKYFEQFGYSQEAL